ncbi:undecaprenyl-phosphate glucose phosphotransferase [Polymorphum gilvum]|uniref:Bacterial sugar transferase n=1 Tax=Polymorphum gilvum (strain LMG 25793 / CGMCC 1.9160 / SL003B-26A1) TaxID=991905 RepID=F2IWN4_POLGS|nr:undecaprenyl-phosphate glucose phosphotransferase [Polymorphum gilvum]ADZ70359.1 Bacterial sugar transferase [Polymorphum gilvum SL003B-26A1]
MATLAQSSISPAPPPEAEDAASLRRRLAEELRRGTEGPGASSGAPKADLSPEATAIADSLRTDGVSLPVLEGSVRLIDGALVLATGLAALAATVGLDGLSPLSGGLLAASVLFALAFFQAFDCYQVSVMRAVFAQVGRIASGWTLVFAMVAIALVTTPLGESIASPWLGLWYAGGLVTLAAARLLVSRRIRTWMAQGRLERRAVIVGGGSAAADLIHELESQPDNDIRICGIFDDRASDRSPPVVAGYPKLGNIDALVEFARLARIDMLIVCIPVRAEQRVLELLRKLWVLPIDIRLSAHTDKLRFRSRASSFIGTVPFIDVVEKPITNWDMVAKRVFDIVFASAALVALSPVMLATALAIKLDSRGPVLFRQKRYGFNNEIIEVLKFRSMYHEMADPDAKRVVTKGDPRVTRVGRFIRRASIDELPQLFNVLSGELSLVGPRPHAVNAHTDNKTWDEVVYGYYARHKVKPGVTGWAQINGWRGEVDTPEKIQKRVECDLYYIENWSIPFDLYILVMTPIRLLNTENAY